MAFRHLFKLKRLERNMVQKRRRKLVMLRTYGPKNGKYLEKKWRRNLYFSKKIKGEKNKHCFTAENFNPWPEGHMWLKIVSK